jgi:sulfite exporter TauE/SafE
MLNIFSGYLAGLSVGIYCLGLCLPIFLPILMSEKRDLKKSGWLILEFSIGRLAGYLTFGFVFGWLGQIIQNPLIHSLVSLGNLWMGIVLIIYSLGKIDQKICAFLPFKKIRWPLLIGFLTGVNICPPFLASLTHIFNLRSAIQSMLYFLTFFLGTSTYLVPAVFLGSRFTQYAVIQKFARIAGVLTGIYFISKNITLLF